MRIITIDTTGLKGRIQGWEPRVVAVGGAEIRNGALVAAFGAYIHAPPEHVHDERAQGAWRSNGIDTQKVIEATLSEKDASFLLREWVGENPVTGFNVPFLSDFLKTEPWNITQLGETPCVMDRASKLLSKRKRQFILRVSLNDALSWASGEGYELSSSPGLDTRAEANAIRIALLSIALEKEEQCQK